MKKENSYHMHYLIVSPLTNILLVQLQLFQECLPLLSGDEGGRVHGAAVADHQAVLTRLLSHAEVRILDGYHSTKQILLKIKA